MEYSTSPSYSNPVSGTGTKISLVPGQDLYLWVKATASSFASLDFHLVVPNRPAQPVFTIDFSNEKTMENVSSGYSYSISPAFTNPINGVGNKVSLIPGQDLYLMMNPTSVAFASVIQQLIIPERQATPNISIDYINEISSVVSSALEWSLYASISPATQGLDATLNIVPGTDLYFRRKATSGTFKSEIQHLVVPVRPSTPNVLINYSDETTGIIPSSIVWSLNAPMTPATQGQNQAIPVTPGIDLYFMTQATQSGFKSSVQHLIIANRPAAPAYSINYQLVKTNEPVIAADDYATNNDMTNAIPGTNAAINLTPGTDLYFRTRSTSSSFYSHVQFLEVKPRPETPVFTIDYITGTTSEIVDADIVYSSHANFSGSANGNGEVLEIEPGRDVYFMQNSASSSFSSEVFHLVVPGSNFLGYSGADTVSSGKVVMYAILADPGAVLSLDDIQVTNGTAENLRQGNLFDVYSSSKGNVTVVIPANAVINNSFASNEVIVYFNNTSTGVTKLPGDHLVVYPNPSKTGIIFVKTGLNVPCSIDVLSYDGVLLKSLYIEDNQFINLQDLNKGMYLLHIRTGKNYSVHKVVLE